MQDNYPASLAIILKEEGGNDDDPRDPGGRTSRGIIQREWNVFRQTHQDRPQDVWQASNDDVATIYKDNYWNPYCDRMPAGVDLVFFNTAVNSGRQQAVKELQRALGQPADGMMGMITFNALDQAADVASVVKDMCERRRSFYRALKTFPTFGKGWLARTDRIEKSALAMALNSPGNVVSAHPIVATVPSPLVTISAKAAVADVDQPAISPEATGAASAGSGSLLGALDQIKDQLTPLGDTVVYVKYLLVAITIAGVIYMTYGIMKRNRVAAAVG